MPDRMDPKLTVLDGQIVVQSTVEPIEDVDGMPSGMAKTSEPPALLTLPWGHYGWPDRPDEDDPQDIA